MFHGNLAGRLDEASREAAPTSLNGLARVHAMLAAVEVSDLELARGLRNEAVNSLVSAAEQFESLSEATPMFEISPDAFPTGQFPRFQPFRRYMEATGWGSPVTSNDLPLACARQIRQLAEVVEATTFVGDATDSAPGQRVIDEVVRTLQVGSAVAELAPLFLERDYE